MIPSLSKNWKPFALPCLAVALLVLLCLVPFLNKPIHIDDTLFLRVAEQIQKKPLDAYGFQMNWYGNDRPMTENFNNPPMACYYLALSAALGGWSEVALHLAFLLPAILAGCGIFCLARYHVANPLAAAAIAVLTPVFVVSGTTLMCDTLLLALWTWSVVCFEKGLREGPRWFCLSGILAGFAICTKFIGLGLVPLLVAYGLFQQPRKLAWLWAILLATALPVAYEAIAQAAYGKGILLTAIGVSSKVHSGTLWDRVVLGLSFLGGCFLPLLLYGPRLWSLRQLVIGLLLALPVLIAFPYSGKFALLWGSSGELNWLLVAQSVLFIISGCHILALALSEMAAERNASAALLGLWVLGIFVFATALNWTINGRSLLPMLPAVGILTVRQMERRTRQTQPSSVTRTGEPLPRSLSLRPAWGWTWSLGTAAGLSLWLACEDYSLADTGRKAAEVSCARYQRPNRDLWFEGHWGFQYYMEQRGAKALDRNSLTFKPGDVVIVPSEAVNTFDISTDLVCLIDTLEYRPNRFCSSMSLSAGAGFYSATAGPFPFSCGTTEPERYYVFEVTQSLQSALSNRSGLSPIGAITQQFAQERAAQAQKRGESGVRIKE